MGYPNQMEVKSAKKGVAASVALALALGLPGQGYQAFALQLEAGKTGDAVQILPPMPADIELETPASQLEFPNDSISADVGGARYPALSDLNSFRTKAIPPEKKSLWNGNLFSAKQESSRGFLAPVSRVKSSLFKSGSASSWIGILSGAIGIGGRHHRSQSALSDSFAQEGARFYDGEKENFSQLPEPIVSVSAGRQTPGLGLKKAGLVVAGALGASALAIPAYAQSVSGAAGAGGFLSAATLGSLFSQGAYWISMGLGFMLALPELYSLVKNGKYDWRTYGLIAANLSVGLIVAPAQSSADKFLWGAETLSVALILAAGIGLARFFRKKGTALAPSEKPEFGSTFKRWTSAIAHDRILQGTLILSPLLIAAGFGLYFSVAAFVPAWITTVLAVKISLITAAIQILVQGFYLSLFVPDLLSIRAGHKPQGFSPGFVLIFCLIAACFVIWGGLRASIHPLAHMDLVLLALSNVLQFIFSFITYRALRRPNPSADDSASHQPRLTQNTQGTMRGGLLRPRLVYA